ncbi:MAG: TraR/DksA C4-type zinc finger protein [Desulfobulbales bacterium]|nr:TraR/DksA C4-type zinc finger protein [Desulfobulbales bacterium]
MISQADRDRLRRHIRQEQEKVRRDIVYLGAQSGPVAPSNAIGRLSRMDAIGARNINGAKLRDARSRLVLLDYALTRIDHPDFGLCTSCGDPISLARLQFLPESRFCVECAG